MLLFDVCGSVPDFDKVVLDCRHLTFMSVGGFRKYVVLMENNLQPLFRSDNGGVRNKIIFKEAIGVFCPEWFAG